MPVDQTPPAGRWALQGVRQNKVTFPILSDVKNEVAAAFGLKFSPPDYLVDLYKSFKNDLPNFDDDPSWTLPMPGRFVIARDGTILYAEVNPDYTRRPDPEDIVSVLKGTTYATKIAA